VPTCPGGQPASQPAIPASRPLPIHGVVSVATVLAVAASIWSACDLSPAWSTGGGDDDDDDDGDGVHELSRFGYS
jgi:hypothetical protein